MPLHDLLVTIRSEFSGQIDEETNAVLANYEALFEPSLIPNPHERQAVVRCRVE